MLLFFLTSTLYPQLMQDGATVQARIANAVITTVEVLYANADVGSVNATILGAILDTIVKRYTQPPDVGAVNATITGATLHSIVQHYTGIDVGSANATITGAAINTIVIKYTGLDVGSVNATITGAVIT